MTTTTPGELTTQSLDDASVAEYLRAHPDFLLRHPSVLAAVEVPHEVADGPVSSLIERTYFLAGSNRWWICDGAIGGHEGEGDAVDLGVLRLEPLVLVGHVALAPEPSPHHLLA